MRARSVWLPGLLVLAGLALAQDEAPPDTSDPRLRFDTDPHGLDKELARIDSYARAGKTDDVVALVDRLLRDPRTKDGFVETKRSDATDFRKRIYASFERVLRVRLLQLPEASRKALDARFDDEARKLQEQGRTDPQALAHLVVRYPFCERARLAALELAERELEAGHADASVAWLRELLDVLADGAPPELLARAKLELPAALALAGRDGEADRALDRLTGDERRRAAELVSLARRERGASAPTPLAERLPEVAWSHETRDYYADKKTGSVEPAADGERVYLHDGSHARALSIETGKVVWRTSLRPKDEGFREPLEACRIALGPDVVACPLPIALVTLDRASGVVLARVTKEELRKAAKIEDELAIYPMAVVSGNVVVLAVEARHADDELSLVGIDARTGALLWRTFLVGEPTDPGAPEPTLARGPDAVYCLSNRGVLAAVEPQTGSVVWLRRYASLRDPGAGGAPMPRPRPFRGGAGAPVPEKPQWRAGFVAFLHGRVVAAPSDAPRVHFCEPRTGEEAWGVNDDGATVLGAWGQGVLEMKRDGQIVHIVREGEMLGMAKDAVLFGRALIAGDALYLPLQTAVARLELTRRNSIARKVCDMDEPGIPANLLAADGKLVLSTLARTKAIGSVPAETAEIASNLDALAVALGDRRYKVREQAESRLVGAGEAARARLETASRASDAEASLRALSALDAIARAERLREWRPRIKDEWLKGETAGLLEKLTHPNAQRRLMGVIEIGRVDDPDVVPLLKDLLKDGDERVRGYAALGLLQKGDRSGMDLVSGLLESTNRDDRMTAVKELGKNGKADDLPIFDKAAKDEDAEVRGEAVMGALACAGEKALPLVKRAIEDKDEKVRTDLVGALTIGAGKLGASLLAPIFHKLCQDSLRGIRYQALTQLRRPELRHDPEAITAFGELLVDQDTEIQKQARLAANNVTKEDMRYFPRAALEKAFSDPSLQEGDRYHFVQIAETVIENGSPFALAPLARTALEAKNPRLRERAIEVAEARVQLTDPLTAEDVAAVASLTLKKAPAEADADTVKDAAFIRKEGYKLLALGRGPDRSAILLGGLADDDHDVAEFAVEALKLGADGPILAELLRREATSEKPGEREAAARILDYIQNPDLLPPVYLGALDDRDERVRARAWKRVRDLALQDEDVGLFEPGATREARLPAMRRAARWWWRKAKDRDPDQIAKGIDAPSPADRWKAAKKLADLGAPEFRVLATDAMLESLAKAAAKESEEYVLRQMLGTFAAITGKPCAIKENATKEERAAAIRVALEWKKK
jgi:HEAT repeat protein